MEILSVPTWDGHFIDGIDSLHDALLKISDKPITVMNDFDVPWVQLTKMKFPKIAKKKRVKP